MGQSYMQRGLQLLNAETFRHLGSQKIFFKKMFFSKKILLFQLTVFFFQTNKQFF